MIKFVNYCKNKKTEPTKKPISNILLSCEFIVNYYGIECELLGLRVIQDIFSMVL